MLGTLEEAQAIFDSVGDCWRDGPLPEGWKRLGEGGTRRVYLSPSGVAYKVARDYDFTPTAAANDREHVNFNRIRTDPKLPAGWRVPKSHLHAFRSNIKRYDYKTRELGERNLEVTVLAVEYIEGKEIGGWGDGYSAEELEDMEHAFYSVGLHDTGGANAIKTNDGTRYIIDAAEGVEVRFSD